MLNQEVSGPLMRRLVFELNMPHTFVVVHNACVLVCLHDTQTRTGQRHRVSHPSRRQQAISWQMLDYQRAVKISLVGGI